MSDFLVSIGNKHNPETLLALLKLPYGEHKKEGRCFSFPWGCMAVLEEHLADNKNIFVRDDTVLSWVGDLALNLTELFIAKLIALLQELMVDTSDNRDIKAKDVFCQFNGAFALMLANQKGFCIVTDLLGFTQVYIGNDADLSTLCVGTHPDVVSAVCNSGLRMDKVSIGEFLSQGTLCFPYTMYENVKELDPGSVHVFESRKETRLKKKFLYWYPPAEIKGQYDKISLAEELKTRFVSAVRNRCTGKIVGVTLSGGLDSRLILALIPQEVECAGLTFCDYRNRETQIARKIAQCYKRQWIQVFRGNDFLADSLKRTVELQGCEFEFFNAHAIGIEKKILDLGLSSILSGVQMDAYFKGYFATDWLCKKRLKGLIADKYTKTSYDHVNTVSDFDKEIFTDEVIDQMSVRRQQHYSEYVDSKRGSIAEWLTIYPFSQDKIGACWAAERRVLPVKLVATDRYLLDFAFRCPVELKLGGRIFMDAAGRLYGRGARIPSANDGVRPGSGHIWRLIQRAIFKSKMRILNIAEKTGVEKKVQHSWHDYQKYWANNTAVHELIHKYSSNLEQLNGVVFKANGRTLLDNKNIDWHYGFRLLQLAVWLGIIPKYRTSSGSIQ